MNKLLALLVFATAPLQASIITYTHIETINEASISVPLFGYSDFARSVTRGNGAATLRAEYTGAFPPPPGDASSVMIEPGGDDIVVDSIARHPSDDVFDFVVSTGYDTEEIWWDQFIFAAMEIDLRFTVTGSGAEVFSSSQPMELVNTDTGATITIQRVPQELDAGNYAITASFRNSDRQGGGLQWALVFQADEFRTAFVNEPKLSIALGAALMCFLWLRRKPMTNERFA